MLKIINHKERRKKVDLPRNKKPFSGKWVYRLVAVLFFATVIFTLFFSDYLTITSIGIAGLNKLEEAPIRNVIENELRGKYLGLVRRDNLIVFSGKKTTEMLLDNFKRIKTVRVDKYFPNGLSVTIEERKLTMLFCSLGNCYVLNEKGEAYGASNFSTEELEKENIITLNDLGDAQIDAETSPLESSFQEFILKLEKAVFDGTGIVLKKQYETPSRMSGDLKVETEDGWKIYFSEAVGIEREILMLRTAVVDKIEKERQKDLEYVDLRIANKVFYKFKEGLEQSQAVENVVVLEVKKEEKKEKKKK
ncbi:MAG: FtsQ-type POTRA domain-containing protein [Candidatus Moraniibacteriota bacterium]